MSTSTDTTYGPRLDRVLRALAGQGHPVNFAGSVFDRLHAAEQAVGSLGIVAHGLDELESAVAGLGVDLSAPQLDSPEEAQARVERVAAEQAAADEAAAQQAADDAAKQAAAQAEAEAAANATAAQVRLQALEAQAQSLAADAEQKATEAQVARERADAAQAELDAARSAA